MASGTASGPASDDAEPPLLRLLHHQDPSLFLPFMLSLPDQQHPPPPDQPDRIVLINPITQGMVVLDYLPPLPSLMDTSHPPASRSSIKALPTVENITAKDGTVLCCAICLEESGEWAREMPCRHRFHGGCIERWLRIHGSCPICRFRMPVDEAETWKVTGDADTSDSSSDHNGHRNSEIWVGFSFTRRNRSSGDDSVSSGDDQV